MTDLSCKITAVSCAALGFVAIVLQLAIVQGRINNKILIGSGNNKRMEMMMRGHGNFVENVPFAMITLLIAEIKAYASSTIIMSIAMAFVVGRISHAYAFLVDLPTATHLRFRQFGMVTSVLAQLVLVAILLYGSIVELRG